MGKERLIKSRKRVRDFAEVYTPKHIVKDMCNLIPQEIWEDITKTFLEPACGNGNFLVEIFERKLSRCETAEDGIIALNSIYGIDIQNDNVLESIERLLDMFIEKFYSIEDCGYWIMAKAVLERNIVCGNSLQPETVPWLKEALESAE